MEAGAREAGFDESTSYACQLAVDEACENIVKHGYDSSQPGEICIAVTASPGALTVRLEDTGEPFNPARRPRQQPWDENDPPVGGLGLLIIHRVMDRVRYLRKAGVNRLTMSKRVPRAPG